MTNFKKTIALLLAVICFVGAWASAAPAISDLTVSSSQSFALGNNPNVIVEGGLFHDEGFSSAGGGIFKNAFSPDSTKTPVKISNIKNARNLNYVGTKLYFTVYTSLTDTTAINSISLSNVTAPVVKTVTTVSGKIRQMYVVSENGSNYILFSCRDKVYRLNYQQSGAEPTAEYTVSASTGFFPTALGDVLYCKVGSKYTLQARRSTGGITNIATNVLDFTVDGYTSGTDTITVYIANSVYTAALSSAFGTGAVELIPKVYPVGNTPESVDTHEAEECSICAASVSASNTTLANSGTSVESVIYQNGEEHELTAGQEDILKRAKQMQAVKWVCQEEMQLYDPRYFDPFLANAVYHGVPYGTNGNYVGHWSPRYTFDAFVDATETEDFYTSNGVFVADCSSFVSHAWGLGERRVTGTLGGEGNSIGTFADGNAATTLSKLQIGDCINVSGAHCILIASLRYNEDGDLVQIVTFEQRKHTASSKRNICVYDSSVELAEGSTYNATYWDESENGLAMPLEAFIIRMQQEKDTAYTALRSKTRENPDFPYEENDNAIIELGTPGVEIKAGVGLRYKTITWSAVANAGDYEVMFSNDLDGTYSKVTTISTVNGANSYNYTTTMLKGYYKIRAHLLDPAGPNEYDRNIYSDYSDAVLVDNTGSAPSNVTLQYIGGAVGISWNAPADATTANVVYTVSYSSTTQYGSYTGLITNTARTFYHVEAPNGILFYKICAVVGGKEMPPMYAVIYKTSTSVNPLGDFNLDGVVDTGDASGLLNYLTGSFAATVPQRVISDVNLDGNLNTGDATTILRYATGDGILPPISAINGILWKANTALNTASINADGSTDDNEVFTEGFIPELYFETTRLNADTVRCTVYLSDNAVSFNALQFRVDWDDSVGEIISATSALETGVIHYENSAGWLKFAFASPVNVTVDETGALMTFDISGIDINPDDLGIVLSESLMFN